VLLQTLQRISQLTTGLVASICLARTLTTLPLLGFANMTWRRNHQPLRFNEMLVILWAGGRD
jgi:hypothetical protein